MPWEYGGFAFEALHADAGWIATARDLTRLLVAVDGFPTKPDLLDAQTLATMTAPSANNPQYALGWQRNGSDTWYHGGGQAGVRAFIARTADGYTWALIINRNVDQEGQSLWADFADIPPDCVDAVTEFPDHDLMERPTVPASNLALDAVSTGSVALSWAMGDGDRRLLVGTEGDTIDAFPLDGTDYTADPTLGLGDDLGGGTFVLYDGEGDSATVTGLQPGGNYTIQLFEYDRNQATGAYPLYTLCDAPTSTFGLPLGPGAVDDSLRLDRVPIVPGAVRLTWGSCSSGAEDYAIYEGKVGDWTSHQVIQCTDLGGDRQEVFVPWSGNRYYLVVPLTGGAEGSFGRDSFGVERAPSSIDGCRDRQELGTCP